MHSSSGHLTLLVLCGSHVPTFPFVVLLHDIRLQVSIYPTQGSTRMEGDGDNKDHYNRSAYERITGGSSSGQL